MKRPKFFEDLDRSLSGEPELEEVPSAPIAIVHDLAAKGRAIQAEERFLQGIEQQTATGAMIAAAQQDQAMRAWYYDQMRQMMVPGTIYDARMTPEQAVRECGFGSIWDALGLK